MKRTSLVGHRKSIHEFPTECNPFRFNKSQNIDLIAHRRFHWCIARCSSQQQLWIKRATSSAWKVQFSDSTFFTPCTTIRPVFNRSCEKKILIVRIRKGEELQPCLSQVATLNFWRNHCVFLRKILVLVL